MLVDTSGHIEVEEGKRYGELTKSFEASHNKGSSLEDNPFSHSDSTANSPILNFDVCFGKHRDESSLLNFVGHGRERTELKSFFLISFKSLASITALWNHR